MFLIGGQRRRCWHRGREGCIRWISATLIELSGTSLRLPVLTLLLIAVASLGESTTAPAQATGAHPVCAIYYGIDADGTPACAFDTREQCMEDISGIGGFCIENQYYHGPAARPPGRVRVMGKRGHPIRTKRSNDSHIGGARPQT